MQISSYHHAPVALSRCPLNMRLGGHQSRFGCAGRDTHFFYLSLFYRSLVATSTSLFIPPGSAAPIGSGTSHYRGITITLRHTTLGRIPLDEWSARRRDLYLITRSTHKRQTSMSPAGFEPTIPASERPQTPSLHRADTTIGDDTGITPKVPWNAEKYWQSEHVLLSNKNSRIAFEFCRKTSAL